MPGSYGVSSQLTTKTDIKTQSSDLSTCSGGIHVCPFQRKPHVNRFSYCMLKNICRKILNEILEDESELVIPNISDTTTLQGASTMNDLNANLNTSRRNFSSRLHSKKMQHKSPLGKKSDPMSVRKSTPMCDTSQTQTEVQTIYNSSKEFYSQINLRKEIKKDSNKNRIILRPEYTQNGIPIIRNLRSQIRNNGSINIVSTGNLIK